MTPSVNQLHTILRAMPLDEAIKHVRIEIKMRGYDVVKADPGIRAWVEENHVHLGLRARLGPKVT